MIADILLSSRPAGPAPATVAGPGEVFGEIMAAPPSGGSKATPPDFGAILRSTENIAPSIEGHLNSEEDGVADTLPVAAIAANLRIDPANPGKTLPDSGKAPPEMPTIEPAQTELHGAAPAQSVPTISGLPRQVEGRSASEEAIEVDQRNQVLGLAPKSLTLAAPEQVAALAHAPRTISDLKEQRIEPALVQLKPLTSPEHVETDALPVRPVGQDGSANGGELRPNAKTPAASAPEELAQLPRADRMEGRGSNAAAPSAASAPASDSLATPSQLQPQSQAQSQAQSQPQPQFAVAVEAPVQGSPKASAAALETLVRDPGQIETLIENLSQARENGRQARGEMQLRHEDFGVLTVKLASSEGELKASLSSRDPAFAVAAQQALGERMVQQVSDSGAANSRSGDQPSGNSAHSGQRGTDPQASGQDRAGSQAQRRDVENRSTNSADDGGDFHAESHRAPRDRWLFA